MGVKDCDIVDRKRFPAMDARIKNMKVRSVLAVLDNEPEPRLDELNESYN